MVFNQNKKVMDLLIKSFLPICFLPLAVTFTLYAGTPVIIEKPDTVTVHSTGKYNQVVIDSIYLKDSLNETILSPVKGEIIQTGENNSVEINTGGEAPNNKKQNSNKSQIPHDNNQEPNNEKHETCNMEPATIKIKQAGKNNSVKINSR
jgi:hypothetical protein